MGHRFAEIAFTESVRRVQQEMGSRASYRSMEGGEDYNHRLGVQETEFIAARDSFYLASVSETGWPYLQHRGGPVGFMRVLDDKTLGFSDFSGNRQYVSTGNFRKDNRVSLFFMDYPNRTRLKLLGKIREISLQEEQLLATLNVDDYRAQVERGFIIDVEGFDWNCPQHITPRYTESHIDQLMASLIEENRQLKLAHREASHHSMAEARVEVLGEGPLALKITGVRQLTPRIRAYELRDPRGGELPVTSAGSHLRIPVLMPNGTTVTRQYSICSHPLQRDRYEIAVLKEDSGSGGSVAVHEQFDLGLTLHCDQPENAFPLHADSRAAVFIAGGIGITPIKSMAQTLAARGCGLTLHYAGRSDDEMAFRECLGWEFGERVIFYRSEQGERLNISRLLTALPGSVEVYACGPSRLIDDVVETANELNINSKRLHFERFTAVHDANDRPITVELTRSKTTLQVNADQSILDAMLDAGVDAPYSCRAGQCKSCAVTVTAGEPAHRDSVLTDTEKQDLHLICPCVSRAVGKKLTLNI